MASAQGNRALKCDVSNILVFEIMGFVSIFNPSNFVSVQIP